MRTEIPAHLLHLTYEQALEKLVKIYNAANEISRVTMSNLYTNQFDKGQEAAADKILDLI